MSFYQTARRAGAGPFGYTLDNLSARTPEEHDELEGELGALETTLQWGFEPGRWQKGAAWHAEDWPEAKLVSGGELAGQYGNRDDLIAEAGDFREVLGKAKKISKRQAGLASPFLPALASLPKHERQRVRNQSKKFRELIAFGDTPERWETGIGYLHEGGHLLNPEADTKRLRGMWQNRKTMLPHLDQADNALDILDELDNEDTDPQDAQSIRSALNTLGLSAAQAPTVVAVEAAAPAPAGPVIGNAVAMARGITNRPTRLTTQVLEGPRSASGTIPPAGPKWLPLQTQEPFQTVAASDSTNNSPTVPSSGIEVASSVGEGPRTKVPIVDPRGSVERIADAAGSAVSGLFNGPYGISREDLGPLVSRTPEEFRDPVGGTVRAFNESLIVGGSQLGDLALRVLAAPVVGGIEAVVQTATELGMSRTDARRLRRDLYMGAEVSAALGTRPLAVRPRLKRGGRKGIADKPGSLVDQVESTGAMDEMLAQFPPQQRKGVLDRLRQGWEEGKKAALWEIEERGLAKVVPYLDSLLAERRIRQLGTQWETKGIPPVNARDIFGDAVDGFPPEMIKSLDGLVGNRFGIAGGEGRLYEFGIRMDRNATEQPLVELPKDRGFKAGSRTFDLAARYPSDVIAEKNALLGRLARWVVGAESQGEEIVGGFPRHLELKAGPGRKSTSQASTDSLIRGNRELAKKLKIGRIEDLRMIREDVPIDFVIEDIPNHLGKWVKRGKLSQADLDLLLRAMRQMESNGVRAIPVENYATLLAGLGAAQLSSSELAENKSTDKRTIMP